MSITYGKLHIVVWATHGYLLLSYKRVAAFGISKDDHCASFGSESVVGVEHLRRALGTQFRHSNEVREPLILKVCFKPHDILFFCPPFQIMWV